MFSHLINPDLNLKTHTFESAHLLLLYGHSLLESLLQYSEPKWSKSPTPQNKNGGSRHKYEELPTASFMELMHSQKKPVNSDSTKLGNNWHNHIQVHLL